MRAHLRRRRIEEGRKVPFPSTGSKRLDNAVQWLLQRSDRIRGKGCPTYYFEGDVPPKLVTAVLAALDPAKTARAKDDGGKEVVYYWGGMPQGASFAFHRGGTRETRNSIRFAAHNLSQSAEWRRLYGDR